MSSRLDEELRKVRDTYNKLKKEYDQVREKLKFFEKASLIRPRVKCTFVE